MSHALWAIYQENELRDNISLLYLMFKNDSKCEIKADIAYKRPMHDKIIKHLSGEIQTELQDIDSSAGLSVLNMFQILYLKTIWNVDLISWLQIHKLYKHLNSILLGEEKCKSNSLALTFLLWPNWHITFKLFAISLLILPHIIISTLLKSHLADPTPTDFSNDQEYLINLTQFSKSFKLVHCLDFFQISKPQFAHHPSSLTRWHHRRIKMHRLLPLLSLSNHAKCQRQNILSRSVFTFTLKSLHS